MFKHIYTNFKFSFFKLRNLPEKTPRQFLIYKKYRPVLTLKSSYRLLVHKITDSEWFSPLVINNIT